MRLAHFSSHTDQDVADQHLDDVAMRRPFGASSTVRGANAGEAPSSCGAGKSIRGKDVVFIPRNSNDSVSGQLLPTVQAIYGVNIIDWSAAKEGDRLRLSGSRRRRHIRCVFYAAYGRGLMERIESQRRHIACRVMAGGRHHVNWRVRL